MSGKRTKQLRKECHERLGRASFKADGHVDRTTMTVLNKDKWGRGILARVWNHLTRQPQQKPQIDEFRFFKRHGGTPQEVETRRAQEIADLKRHRLAVDRNNEHMADLCRESVAEVAA